MKRRVGWASIRTALFSNDIEAMRRDGRQDPGPGDARHLDSWGEIAAYLHRSISTVQRWEKGEGLPVHRIAHSKVGSVYATTDELDAWYAARSTLVAAAGPAAGPAAAPAPAAAVAALEGRIALAVLPFRNLSGSAEQDYFSDGLTEELITHLARLRPDRLRVIARTSAMQYRNTAKDVRAIGAELGVGYVLEGSVRRDGDRVRATAQLVSTDDGTDLWAETYDEAVTGFIEIQTAIAGRVGESLSIHFFSAQSAAHARARQTNPEARDEYLKGRYAWNRRTPDAFREALGFFTRAVQLDPAFAPAYGGLADTYALSGFWFYRAVAPGDAFPLARQTAETALRLDPGLAEAHSTLGLVHSLFDWDWSVADRSFHRALELNPSYATGRQWYSLCLALQGRSPEAIAEVMRARELDVLSYVVDFSVAWMYYLGRDFETARRECVRALKNNPDFAVAHLLLAGLHTYLGQPEQALREHDTYERLGGNRAISLTFRSCHLAHAGDRRAAARGLAELRDPSSAGLSWQEAIVHASLGEADEAFAALEQAFEDHSDALAFLKVEPHWDPLRSDPRFRAVLTRIGLA